jgi:transposase-like protein
MNVPDEIIENWVRDMQKRDITPEQRAELLQQYIKENIYTMKGLARSLSILTTTFHGWLHPHYRDEIQAFRRKSGYNETEVDYALYQFSPKMKKLLENLPSSKLKKLLENLPEPSAKTKNMK